MPKTRRASRRQRGGFLDFITDLFKSTPSTNTIVKKNEGAANTASTNGMLAPPVAPAGGRRKNRKNTRKTRKHRKNTRRSCRR